MGFGLVQELNAKTWENTKIAPSSTADSFPYTHFSGLRRCSNHTLKAVATPSGQGTGGGHDPGGSSISCGYKLQRAKLWTKS